MIILERTTSEVQPLDVGFNRQYKIFVTRIVNQAHLDNMIKDVTSRDGIINMHSIIWNQFSASGYREMLAWCWHKTDPNFEPNEVSGGSPLMVRANQFAFTETACSVESCQHEPFIRCAICGKVLCLRHFLERLCFHDTQVEKSSQIDRAEALSTWGDVDDEFDEEMMQDEAIEETESADSESDQ